jgi:general secretion pathway protein K
MINCTLPHRQYTKLIKSGMVAEFPKKGETLVSPIQLSGGFYDLQARFNLNNLLDKKLIPVFINLMEHTVKSNASERANLALSLTDWIIDYDLGRGKDNYTSYYLSQKPPYYPSHQLMASPTELRLIKDVSSKTFESLEPYITVLPENTPVNINTASKQVLMSIGNGYSEAQVDELIMARGEKGIKNINDISELAKKIDLPDSQITIDSKYFLTVAYVTTDEFKLTAYTLLHRSVTKEGIVNVSIVRESLSSF